MAKLKRWGRDLLLMVPLIGLVMLGMDFLRAPQAPADFAQQELVQLDGRSASLAELRADKPLLVYFWASWCGVCKFTTPSVAELKAEGANVLTVALRSGDDQQIGQWLARKKMALPVVNDPAGRLSAQWQIGVTPTFAIIYRGKVVQSTTGWSSYWALKTRLWWAGV